VRSVWRGKTGRVDDCAERVQLGHPRRRAVSVRRTPSWVPHMERTTVRCG